MNRFFRCHCYYTDNIYVQKYDKHFRFVNKEQFSNEYGKVLPLLGCNTSDKVDELLKELTEEVNRRKNADESSAERKELIKKSYTPIDSSVYKLKDDFLESYFRNLVEISKNLNYSQVLQMVDVISVEKRLYGFPVFTADFCEKLLRELHHFEESSLPKERPNTMNRYGVLLDDLGFYDNFSQPLRDHYLDPLSKVLFPEWRGEHLDSHKIFTVGYKIGQDTNLGYHYDNSEVTLNVCLGKVFEGGELYVGDIKDVPISDSSCILISHKVGYGILHCGQQLHGALPVTSGERHNLILWMRSSSVRNARCPMCNLKPQLVPSIHYGDGFKEPAMLNMCTCL